MNTRGIRAGRAFVEIGTNNTALERGLKRAQARLNNFASSIASLGAKMFAVGAAFGAPVAAGVKAFASLEQQMAKVSTMLANPEQFMGQFKKGIQDLSVEVGESTETLANGLYDILSASVPAEKALEVLAISARAAKAGMTDTGTAADAITTVLNSYGMSAENAGRVSDWMFGIVQRGKTTFNQLAPAMGRVTSIASAAGVSLDELGASIATLTRAGVSTDQAMSAIGATLQAFLKPSTESAEAAEKLGFEMSAATVQSEGLAGVLSRLQGLSADDIAKVFPNVEALRGVLPLLNNFEAFTKDLDAMGDSAGSTEVAFRKMMAGLGPQFSRVRQAIMATAVAIGEHLAPYIETATSHVVNGIKALRDWVTENRAVVLTVAGIIGGVTALGVSLIALAGVTKVVAIAFGGMATVVGIATTALGVAKAAVLALFTPLGLVAGVIGGLGVAVLTYSGAAGAALDWLGEKWGDLKERAGAVLSAILSAMSQGNFGQAARVLWLAIQAEFIRGQNWLGNIWESITNSISDGWHGAMLNLKKFGIDAFSYLLNNWGETTRAMVHGAVEVANFIADVFTNMGRGIADLWRDVTDGLELGVIMLQTIGDEEARAQQVNMQTDDIERRDAMIKQDRAAADAKDISDRLDFRDTLSEAMDEVQNNADGIKARFDEAERKRIEDRTRAQREAQAEADRALANAEAALAGAIKTANQTAEADTTGPDQTDLQSIDDEMAQAVKDLQSRLSSDALDPGRRLEVKGVFDTAAISRALNIGSSSQDRATKAAEATASNTERIAELLAQVEGPVFE